MQQSSLANAAASAANAATQTLNWHKMMNAKNKGKDPQPVSTAVRPVSVPSSSTTASAPTKPATEEDEPPTKKKKS